MKPPCMLRDGENYKHCFFCFRYSIKFFYNNKYIHSSWLGCASVTWHSTDIKAIKYKLIIKHKTILFWFLLLFKNCFETLYVNKVKLKFVADILVGVRLCCWVITIRNFGLCVCVVAYKQVCKY